MPGRRLRSRHHRDARHRSGRGRHRCARRSGAVRDDAGIRRRLAARKDRHARFRRRGRDQQVRPPGRGRCAARRAPAGAAQPRGLGHAACGFAGVRHDCLTLQRRWRHGAVPAFVGAARRARPAAGRRAAGSGHDACLDRQPRAAAAGARASSGRHRRNRARLPPPRRRAGRTRAQPAAGRSRAGDAAGEHSASHWRSTPSPLRRARRSIRRRRGCSPTGRRSRPATAARRPR